MTRCCALAAALEARSEHPLAEAILRGASKRELKVDKVDGLHGRHRPGRHGTVEGTDALLGNARLMQGAGIDVAPLAQAAEARRKRGETVMFLGAGGKLAGIIAVADPIKATAAEAIAQAARARAQDRHGDRRQRDHGQGRGRRARHRRGACGAPAGGQARSDRGACRRRARRSAWPATASTTRRRWPAPMSASPWAPAPTSPWKAPD